MATGQPNCSPKARHLGRVGQWLGAAGHAGHPGGLGGQPRADLVAHDLDGLGRRPDEGHARLA